MEGGARKKSVVLRLDGEDAQLHVSSCAVRGGFHGNGERRSRGLGRKRGVQIRASLVLSEARRAAYFFCVRGGDEYIALDCESCTVAQCVAAEKGNCRTSEREVEYVSAASLLSTKC